MPQLLGKVIIKGDINVLTGLTIGGTTGGLKIGGVDLNVITDPAGKPYIPGSSLKGKLRSLYELNKGVYFDSKGIHMCKTETSYQNCDVCKIWGTFGGKDIVSPTLTRLIVRDTFLDESSYLDEMRQNIDLLWTEVKVETAINRLTGTASGTKSLRYLERVPAGAKFSNCQMIFNVFDNTDKDRVKILFEAMELLENDYLGGMGSRGYGQVEFVNLEVFWNNRTAYEQGNVELESTRKINQTFDTPSAIVHNFPAIKSRLNGA